MPRLREFPGILAARGGCTPLVAGGNGLYTTGKLDLTVPSSPGVRVAVFVVEEPNDFGDLVSAAQSSLGFWDNPMDDEDWNDATPG